jgi:DNA polymerase-3 subunit epsilon
MNDDIEDAIDVARQAGCVVLRPLERRLEYDRRPSPRLAILVDCETTSLDIDTAEPVEVAMQRVWFGAHGITRVEETIGWYDQPTQSISPEATRVHGITDADVADEHLSWDDIAPIVEGAEFLIAHNAAFDCPILCRRFPQLAQIPWACSLEDVDWKGYGFDSTKLRFLLQDHCGMHAMGHHAESDVDALCEILGTPFAESGLQPFTLLVESASTPKTRIEAWGAPYEVKDQLKERGYRWDAGRKVWVWTGDASDAIKEAPWAEQHAACRPRVVPLNPLTRFL